MPEKLRHQVHARELLKLLDRIIPAMESPERFQSIRDWIADPDVTEAVYEERDRLFNLPIPTPAGNLVPGSLVSVKTKSEYGPSRTIKAARVSGNTYGTTKLNPDAPVQIFLERNGQTLRISQREVVEIVLISPAIPVHGG